MTPPKTMIKEAKKGLVATKKFFGAQQIAKSFFFGLLKMKKLIFSKNPTSLIWLNIGGGSHSGPDDPYSVRPLGSIR